MEGLFNETPVTGSLNLTLTVNVLETVDDRGVTTKVGLVKSPTLYINDLPSNVFPAASTIPVPNAKVRSANSTPVIETVKEVPVPGIKVPPVISPAATVTERLKVNTTSNLGV